MTDIDALADMLVSERAAHTPFHPIHEVIGDPAAAYRVQDEVIARQLARGDGPIVGWKIGLTTTAMQAMCGIDTPVAGAIMASTVRTSPATLGVGDFGRLGLESEVALRIRTTPPEGAERDPAATLASLDALAAAFEVVDDRGCDYVTQLDACSLIADNSWNAGAVLGEARPIGDRPLAGLRGELVRDAAALAEGLSADTLQVVGWLSDHLRTRGHLLEPGQWVLTGSVVRTEFPRAGEHYRLTIADLPPVECRTEEEG